MSVEFVLKLKQDKPHHFQNILKKQYPEIYQNILLSFGKTFKEKVFNFLTPNINRDCIICGDEVKFDISRNQYSKTCSRKCQSKNPNVIKKQEKTLTEKYGTAKLNLINIENRKPRKKKEIKKELIFPIENVNGHYCVYLTIYRGDKFPPLYIGSTSIKRLNEGYRGSVKSIKYQKLWKQEQKQNPHLFETKILSTYFTREEALIRRT